MSKSKPFTPSNKQFDECIRWALNPWVNAENIYGGKKKGKKPKSLTLNEGQTCKELWEKAKQDERKWGNDMINAINNNNWTTKLGEGIVYELLSRLGKNPRYCIQKQRFKPDWETDDYIIEVKTSNWTVTGTAGEKVLGAPYKYSEIPELYGKPLKIICVAYQEWELTHGPTPVFGDVSAIKKEALEFWKNKGIEYVKFSDLIAELGTTQSAHQSSSQQDS